MKRTYIVIAVIAIIAIAVSIISFHHASSRLEAHRSAIPSTAHLKELIAQGVVRVNAPKFVSASKTYAANLKADGQAVPSSVALQQLVAKGLLRPADVSGFAGMDVTVSLVADYANPQDVLLRIRMQDGSQSVALADGSVQLVSR
jgi:hypothetical protein